MLHALLVLAFLAPIAVLGVIFLASSVIALILGGQNADGGLAAVFAFLARISAKAVDGMRGILSTHKPVAYTFKGAVRYWRKQLAIARDVDSKNFEPLADLKRYALRNLPKDFDYGSKPNNSFHKQFRFAKYVISKRAKAAA